MAHKDLPMFTASRIEDTTSVFTNWEEDISYKTLLLEENDNSKFMSYKMIRCANK